MLYEVITEVSAFLGQTADIGKAGQSDAGHRDALAVGVGAHDVAVRLDRDLDQISGRITVLLLTDRHRVAGILGRIEVEGRGQPRLRAAQPGRQGERSVV